MATPLKASGDWTENWRASIAIKITAGVLYAVAFIGFMVAVLLLRNVERELLDQYDARADRFAYRVALVIRGEPPLPAPLLEGKVRELGEAAGVAAFEFEVDHRAVPVGEPPADALVLTRTVPAFLPGAGGAPREVRLRIFFPSVRTTGHRLRNRYILTSVVATLLFGLFLAWIILKFITKPFRTLIDAAKAVSGGNLELRLETGRQDEFGYLSTFFNLMLDRITNELAKRRRTNEALLEEVKKHKLAKGEIGRLRHQNELILDSAGEGIQGLDAEGLVTFLNPAAVRILGWDAAELLGRHQHEKIHHTRADGRAYPSAECRIHAALRDGRVHHVDDEVFWRGDGTSFPVEYTSTPIRDERGAVVGTVVVFRDISERRTVEEEQRKLQSQFMQAQKMESVGRLAGGVAHDFNNILSAILTFSELSLMKLEKSDPLVRYLTVIRESAERAAQLTRQLLAFSRRQVLEMKVVDLNEIAKNLMKMLTVMIGEDVGIEMAVNTPVRRILADRGQLEQILMNLAVNARDAMPAGGRLKIATADVDLDAAFARKHKEISPGAYVRLSVTDSGLGMTPEVRAKIFEPFFTTKGLGKGTGLGLATVFGIVKQHNGYIYVESEPGQGAAFEIYFPAASRGDESAPAAEKPGLRRGTETVLVVDDDRSIQTLIEAILKPLGYEVLLATDGREALQVCGEHPGKIDLLLTDVIMKGMNGKELATQLQALRPETRVIFMSGYTDDLIAPHGILEPGVNFLQKPITFAVLMRKFEEVLGKT